jgi:uncharacterized protein (TIGR02186 family)
MTGRTLRRWLIALLGVLLAHGADPAQAQQSPPPVQQKRGRLPATKAVPPAQPAPAAQQGAVAEQPPAPPPQVEMRETVQADVSTRSVAITSSFTGTEIVVFGAVDNSRQASAESGLYDVVIVLEGTPTRLVARRKSNVGGIWINTQSITFESIPSYYAIASTRPLDELADPILLRESDIGFEQVRMTPIRGWETGLSTADLAEFKSAVIRLKQKEGLYVQEQYGVVFIGWDRWSRASICCARVGCCRPIPPASTSSARGSSACCTRSHSISRCCTGCSRSPLPSEQVCSHRRCSAAPVIDDVPAARSQCPDL